MLKKKYFPLISIILVSLAIRYPMTYSPIGKDTWDTIFYTSTILEMGYAVWIINPLSFFGLYPASDNAGIYYQIGTLSQLCGISVEMGMLLVSFSNTILLINILFMFHCLLKFNSNLSYFSILFFTNLPLVIRYTHWMGTPRMYVVILFLCAFFCQIRYFSTLSIRYILLFIFLLVGTMSMHGSYTFGVFIYSIPSFLFFIFKRQANFLISFYRPSINAPIKFRSVLIISSIILAWYLSANLSSIGDFSEIAKFKENSIFSLDYFESFAITTLGYYGPMILVAFIGYMHFNSRDSMIKNRQHFLLPALVVPLALNIHYLIHFNTIIFFVLFSYGLIILNKYLPKKAFILFLSFSVFSILIWSSFIHSGIYNFNEPWESDYNDDEYDLAIYTTNRELNGMFFIRDSMGKDQHFLSEIHRSSIAHYTEKPPLLAGSGGEELIYGFETKESIEGKIYRNSLIYSFTDPYLIDANDRHNAVINREIYYIENVDNELTQQILNQYNVFVIDYLHHRDNTLIISQSIDKSYKLYVNDCIQISDHA